MRRHRRPQSLLGFTLIEVMVVLALAALLATIVGVSLTGAAQAARLEDVLDGIESFDRVTRDQARRFRRPVRMSFNLDRQTIERVESIKQHSQVGNEFINRTYVIPLGFRMSRILHGDEDVTSGETAILTSSLGHAQSYAMRLERIREVTQKSPSPAESSSWIFFAGLTGQSTRVPHEQQARQLLDMLATTTVRHDDH